MLRSRLLRSHQRRSLWGSQSSDAESSSQEVSLENAWRETKNRQGRIYYVNQATGERTWDRPEPNAKILPQIQVKEKVKIRNFQEGLIHVLTRSAGAYYGVFVICCGILAYRIIYPPHPPDPKIGPAPDA